MKKINYKTLPPLVMEKRNSEESTEKLGNRPVKAKNEQDYLPIKQKIHQMCSSCKAHKILLFRLCRIDSSVMFLFSCKFKYIGGRVDFLMN